MTYEEVLALTEANSKAIAALRDELRANARAEQLRREQDDSRRAEENARRDKENARRDKEFAESQARWDKFMERYGGYVDNDSRKVENFFIEGLRQQDLVVGPIKFNHIIPNAQRLDKKVVVIELDGLLINGTTIGLLEVKSTLHRNDVTKVKKSLIPRFRKYYPEYQDKELTVIVAGELINSDAITLARELGYIVLKPGHQGLNVDVSGYRAA